MEDQLIIMKRMALAEKFNNSSKRVVHLKKKALLFCTCFVSTFCCCIRDPGRIRTPNPQSRNLIFYPVELLGLFVNRFNFLQWRDQGKP